MKHVRGAVGLAHAGDPKYADSQLYIMKTASPGSTASTPSSDTS